MRLRERCSPVAAGLLACGLSCVNGDAGETDSTAGTHAAGTTNAGSGAGSSSVTGSGAGTSSSDTSDTGTSGATGADGCAPESPVGLMDCIERERYIDDLAYVAQLRTPGSPHWLAVQERCAEAFEDAGFTVELRDYGTGVNVVGTRVGVESPDELVIASAHYDHIDSCPGADDNATGVAGVLELARALSQVELARTVVVACWDEEELGLLGSTAHAEAASVAGEAVEVVYVFDMIGYASDEPNSQLFPGPLAAHFPALSGELAANEHRGDFIAIVSDETTLAHARSLEGYAEGIGRATGILALADDEKFDDAFVTLRASDHASFWGAGIPALLIFDTGIFRNAAYHCSSGLDTIDRLDHDFAMDVLKATVAAVATSAGFVGPA